MKTQNKKQDGPIAKRWTWSPLYCETTHLGAFSTQFAWVTVQRIGDKCAELVKWFPGCGFSPDKKTYYGQTAFDDAKRAGARWLRASYSARR